MCTTWLDAQDRPQRMRRYPGRKGKASFLPFTKSGEAGRAIRIYRPSLLLRPLSVPEAMKGATGKLRLQSRRFLHPTDAASMQAQQPSSLKLGAIISGNFWADGIHPALGIAAKATYLSSYRLATHVLQHTSINFFRSSVCRVPRVGGTEGAPSCFSPWLHVSLRVHHLHSCEKDVFPHV